MDPMKLKNFVENYQIEILNDQKYREVRRPEYFTDPEDAHIVKSGNRMTSERVFILEIPERCLRALIATDISFYQNFTNTNMRSAFMQAMDLQEEERAMRETSPDVKEAWEQYSMLLNLKR